MFVTLELTKREAMDQQMAPTLYPFVFAIKLWFGKDNSQVAPFWTDTFGATEDTQERYIVDDVVRSGINHYAQKSTAALCISDQQSFYFDIDNQILYIHIEHDHCQLTVNTNYTYRYAIGLTNDKPRYFYDIPFYPYISDLSSIEKEVDKFDYDELTLLVDTITFNNRSGFFNQFQDAPLYGNIMILKTGEEGDEYTDLVERLIFYIEDYDLSAEEFSVDIQDIRSIDTLDIPSETFSQDDYEYLDDDDDDEIIPFVCGPVIGVPGTCINPNNITKYTDSDGNTAYVDPQFIFCSVVSEFTTVYIEDSDSDTGYTALTAAELAECSWDYDADPCILTIPFDLVCDSDEDVDDDDTYTVSDVKADLTGLANSYGSDPIKQLSERYLGVSYDEDNYDIDTWETEEKYLAPIGWYLDSQQSIYEWFADFQCLSSVGFRFDFDATRRRKILVDNPNRDVKYTIPNVHVGNILTADGEKDIDEIYNIIDLKYNVDQEDTDTYDEVVNEDYLTESETIHGGIISEYDKTIGVLDDTEASNRAAIQAEDDSFVRNNFTIELWGEKYFDIDLYDVLEVELTLEQLDIIRGTVLKETTDSSEVELIVQDTIGADEEYEEQFSQITTETVGDELFGTVRGQVVSVQPDFELKKNTITLRERAYSDVWEDIYGE